MVRTYKQNERQQMAYTNSEINSTRKAENKSLRRS